MAGNAAICESVYRDSLMSEKKVFVRSQQKMFRSKDGSTHKSHDVTFNPTNKQWIFGGRRWSANPQFMLKSVDIYIR